MGESDKLLPVEALRVREDTASVNHSNRLVRAQQNLVYSDINNQF